jgi:phytoene dehydrogenase-like protein
MVRMSQYDAVVVGAGPNGLSAAVELTRNGRRVLIVEGADVIGGGTRTEELTVPGFLHDICSAIHPLGAASPFFREIGIKGWIQPDVPVTHPLDGGRAGVIHRDLSETVDGLGPDGAHYRRLIGGLVPHATDLVTSVLGPLEIPPRHPITLTRFGAPGLVPASVMARGLRTQEGKGLLSGLAAHAIAPLSTPLTGAVSELFAVAAHAYGWPLQRGGSQHISSQLAAIVVDGGGTIETGRMIRSLDQLPKVPIVLLDVMPDTALRIGGRRIEARVRRRLARWRNGPGVFKVDWALDGPVPWVDDWSGRSGTVHVGGTYEEVAAAESAVHVGDHPDRPFIIVTQQSLFDPTRAPDGKQTLWGYCHVPAASTIDMTDRIESQIERFAPGFRDLILGRRTMGPDAYEAHNPNYVAGDIAGGAFSLRKSLRVGSGQYRLSEGLYLCSSATSPGAGVHGMCGYHAARAAIGDRR